MREAARKMHQGGYVHGDLCEVNILYQRRCQDIVDIVFVDWDWAGVAKEVEYPAMMNMEVPLGCHTSLHVESMMITC